MVVESGVEAIIPFGSVTFKTTCIRMRVESANGKGVCCLAFSACGSACPVGSVLNVAGSEPPVQIGFAALIGRRGWRNGGGEALGSSAGCLAKQEISAEVFSDSGREGAGRVVRNSPGGGLARLRVNASPVLARGNEKGACIAAGPWIWWLRRDLNPGPQHYECRALTS